MDEKIANKYILREFIGKGKFGSVYKGQKIGIGEKMVAIKFEAKNADIPLLKKETRILEYLARNGLHDIVPTIYWYGLHRNYMCVVMSYLGDIYLDSNSLDSWFQSAICILEKIHLYGVIHRDLKPGHFLFSNGKWKLIDFGFACFVSDENSPLEKDGGREYVIGTPNYISYNVHLGKEPGKKDDMISLGYIFLEKYRGGLSWTSSSLSSFDNPENYPVNHLLHPVNQWKQSLKEPDIFFREISDIPFLTKYMQKYYF